MVGTFSLLGISHFPFLFCPSSTSTSASTQRIPTAMATANSTRIAIVGDVHDDWELEADSKALQFLQPDVVFFTGDFGNENVELVRSISELKMAKAVILGNHDCVYTRQFSQKTKDGVQLQLEWYGVHDMEESAERIYAAAGGTPENHFLVILAHNGPTGLGSNAYDICGKDWVHGGGDHGDPDLAQAVSKLKETTKYPLPLVVFGHMHKGLACGGLRKMLVIGADGTMYLNGAVVPRVKLTGPGCSVRAFTMVDFAGSEVTKVTETWVFVDQSNTMLKEEYVLFRVDSNSMEAESQN